MFGVCSFLACAGSLWRAPSFLLRNPSLALQPGRWRKKNNKHHKKKRAYTFQKDATKH